MTENQKLREALQAVIAAHEAGMREVGERMRAANQTSVQIEGEALLDVFAAIELARQAIALPTAAPVGERDRFEQFAQNCPMGKYNVARRGEGYDSSHTQIMWDAWQARAALSTQQSPFECTRSHPHEMMSPECALRTEIARLTNENARLKATPALSAGDAVDGQRYRWLKGRSQVCMNQVWIGGYTTRQRDSDFLSKEDALSAIDAAIDAAMRKGQL